ncbi:hypothetical protein HanRHA438_Chr03g0112411 [Helianthus annuus]|uniref:Uncharacterized protein n=1 Tax=Helianthus annuus TaxID=4232 RepID=A0A251T5I9_HELAN|nr:hypothetical protein HanXRQr2_Chr03g0101651 [Helianthus annuus]KAJ0934860.1 hypothetical protein HanRHA438_Chr03g0112411 [Helianthus annuus]KAJ0942928.1 hypothetical protein HanPSC8_Chr03g0097971 [Helianthus annuus]
MPFNRQASTISSFLTPLLAALFKKTWNLKLIESEDEKETKSPAAASISIERGRERKEVEEEDSGRRPSQAVVVDGGGR